MQNSAYLVEIASKYFGVLREACVNRLTQDQRGRLRADARARSTVRFVSLLGVKDP